MKKILVIGSGGREHALAWSLKRAGEVFIAPGNGGTLENVPIEADNIPSLLEYARQNKIDLTVVGPEVPLSNGIVDMFKVTALPIFGPTKAAAQLESSKAFAKDFMRRFNIPTAEYSVFEDITAAKSFVRAFKRPVVVKADGLAAGKGVFVCDTVEQADSALDQIMKDKVFGSAGNRVVIEERLQGREISMLAFCDGQTIVPMPTARDHKRALDNDEGLNTGGMGAFAPTDDMALMDDIMRVVLKPTVEGMIAMGTPYVGILYAGLMLTANGIMTLEFNCRFGDPETQVILPLLKTDLYQILQACVDGTLADLKIEWKEETCATVILASQGYPGDYPKNIPITLMPSPDNDVIVFHAGTKREGEQIVTNGGRVLAVTALGKDLKAALNRCYNHIKNIQFKGMHYRRDIGRTTMTYAAVGVDIEKGTRAVDLMKEAVRATYTPDVISDVGNFGGLYAAGSLKTMNSPVLVASTDGAGTKTKVAVRLKKWDTIGQDLVNHCINDILVQGAKPLFFLDYVASSKLNPDYIADIVKGMAKACQEAGCALIGGETAEMPGVYQDGEVDVAGTMIGVVDRAHLIDGKSIKAGDVILALPSTGLHTNGYSLARHVLRDMDWESPHADLGCPIGEALLAVHRSYLKPIQALQHGGIMIKGLAHITGGGVIDNLPRILPENSGAVIKRGSWQLPPIFTLIQKLGGIEEHEMFRTFNMGLGMLIVLDANEVEKAKTTLNEPCFVVGEIVAQPAGVTFA